MPNPRETIAAYYLSTGSIFSYSTYHISLLYTDKTGTQYIATSYPELYGSDSAAPNTVVSLESLVVPGNLTLLANLAKDAVAAATNATSSLGPIKVLVSPLASLTAPEQAHWLGTASAPFASEVVASGADLSQQWTTITKTYAEVGQANIPYSAMTLNSNSVAGSALYAANLAIPADTAAFAKDWSLAVNTLVNVPETQGRTPLYTAIMDAAAVDASALGTAQLQADALKLGSDIATPASSIAGELTNLSADVTSVLGDLGSNSGLLSNQLNSALAGIKDFVSGKYAGQTDPLFDAPWFATQYRGLALPGADLYAEYMNFGWQLGLKPNAWFDPTYYRAQNPDVAATGVNPLVHFETQGWLEGRNPSAGFSVADYLAANPDVKASGVDPLVEFLTEGQAQGRAAYAVPVAALPQGVDPTYYYANNPDVAAAGDDATSHYFTQGFTEGRNPDAFFDTNYYLTQNSDVKAAGIDPLQHYVTQGFLENRDISLVFDAAKYDAAHPGFTGDALLAWLATNPSATDTTYISGGTEAVNALVDTAFYDRQLGATLIPGGTAGAQQAMWSYDTSGWQNGLDPNALFSTNYYLTQNADIAAAHINPMLHYQNQGWLEGRDPSAAFSTTKYLAAYADAKAANIDPLTYYYQVGQYIGEAPIHT